MNKKSRENVQRGEAQKTNSANPDAGHPSAPSQGAPSAQSEMDWLRGVMAEAPWLFYQKDSGHRIPAYLLPGADEPPAERPVPDLRILLRQVTDSTVNGHGLEQRICEYVQGVVSTTDVPHESRTAQLAAESSKAASLTTDLAMCFSRARTCSPTAADCAHQQLAECSLRVIREFVALAKEGNHAAVFRLIEIAEAAIAGLEDGDPQLDTMVGMIAATKEHWPQLCGALPEDRDRVQKRLITLGVGTKTTARKSYGGRGRPISYDPSKTPVNAVAESLLHYIIGVRRSCGMHAGQECESQISEHLLGRIAGLPDLDAASVKEWVRVAEEIVQECCGLDLEGIPGLVSEDALRNYERRRDAGDELFDSDIRDNVRASLVQSFKTIAQPGAR
jgi:hypothetical protein